MRNFLCLDCVSLVHGDDHVCRVPYPKSDFDSGAARIGVLNLACVGKLWMRRWRIMEPDKTVFDQE